MKSVSMILFYMTCFISLCQDLNPESAENQAAEANSEPLFKGGPQAWEQFLMVNFRYPRQAARMGIEGTVVVGFTVEENGAVTNPKIIKGIGAGCDEEVLRITYQMPNWIPAKENGRPVRQRTTQNIRLVLSDFGIWIEGYEPAKKQESVYESQKLAAQFPGGVTKLNNFFRENLSYPEEAQGTGIEGSVFVEFIVEEDGSITNQKLLKGIGQIFDQEALRLVDAMPNWTPGQEGGSYTRQRIVQHVEFKAPTPDRRINDSYDGEVFVIVEEPAEFLGGKAALQDFIQKNVKYPEQERQEGIVVVQFVVEPNGSISNIWALRGIGEEFEKQAINLIASMPHWVPARQRGKIVRQVMVQSIPFWREREVRLEDLPPVKVEPPFLRNEVAPTFPGGLPKWADFLKRTLKYPREAQRMGIEGRVILQFTVEEDGSIANPKILKGIGSGCDEEVLRIAKLMPKWIPGTTDGVPTRQTVIQAVTFKFADGSIGVGKPWKLDDIIVEGMEKPAQFPGGPFKWFEFIRANLRYPKEAKDQGIEGEVQVGFVVEPDGRITNVELVEGIGAGCDEEALRVIALMPNWNPGVKEGFPIRQRHQQGISFKKGMKVRRKELPSDEIFTIVEEPADFPGGIRAFHTYIAQNTVYPEEALKGRVAGKVHVQFVIYEDGSMNDIQVLKGIGAGCDEEALRVLSEMPNWTPAEQRGVKVKQKIIQGITFRLPSVFDDVSIAMEYQDLAKGLQLSNRKYDKLDPQISQLPGVEVVNVQGNSLQDLSPLTLLPLREIYAADNFIESLPADFGKLQSLILLSLNGNKLKQIPSEIFELENLEILDLSFNEITEIPAEISNLKKLKVLSVQGNRKIASLPNDLSKLKDLEVLYVGGTSVKLSQANKLARKNTKIRIYTEIEE